MIYDLAYYGPIASATDPDEAVEKLRSALVKLRDEHNLVSDPEQAKKLKAEIMNVSESQILQAVNLFEKGTDGKDVKDRLFVMVDKR